MLGMGTDATSALAGNVRRLILDLGWSQVELARRAGLAQKTVNDLLNYGRTAKKTPTLATIEAISAAFDISPWHLQIPDLPLDLLKGRRVDKLVENFRDASDMGRENVLRIAESEVRYQVVVESDKKAG